MANFALKFTSAPPIVLDFLFSDNFLNLIEELVKKFELEGESERRFSWFCQNIAVRAIELSDSVALASEIQKQLELPPEPANQLAHLIWTRLKPLVDKLWKEAGEQQAAVAATPQAELTQLIEQIKQQQGPSRNIVDLTRVAKTSGSVPPAPRSPAAAISIPITPEHPPVIQPLSADSAFVAEATSAEGAALAKVGDAPKPNSPLIARVIPVNTGATQIATPINPGQKLSPIDQPRSATSASVAPVPPATPLRPTTPPAFAPQIKPIVNTVPVQPATKPLIPSSVMPSSIQSIPSIKPPPAATKPVAPTIKTNAPPAPTTSQSTRSELPVKSTLPPVTFIPSPQPPTAQPTPKQTPPPSPPAPKQPVSTKKPAPSRSDSAQAPDVIDLSHL